MINVDELIEAWDKAGVEYKECICPDFEYNKGNKFGGEKGLITKNGDIETFFPYSLLHLLEVEEAVKAAVHGATTLEHHTRIVGYFSAVGGWNPSARGQLNDRIRGMENEKFKVSAV